MWHLLKSELIRFRGLALAFGIAHLIVLRGLVSYYADFFGQDAGKISIGFLIFSISGLIFGLYQIGSYKKLNQWTYLIHRPLAPAKIFLALSGGAATLFGAVFAAPMLVITLYVDFMTSQLVDFRQYLLAPFIFGIVFAFYLVGCFIMLSASRVAFLLLALPVFFVTREAVGLWVFLPQLVVLAWLSYLAYVAFKPNLKTHLRRPAAVVMSALPIQYALFWALSLFLLVLYSTVVAFQEEGWKSYAAHSWNDYFPAGTFLHTEYRNDPEVLAHGLAESDSPRLKHLRKQIELADIFELPGPRFARFPVRHQLMFMDFRWEFFDQKNEISWKFSHDRMLFHGRSLRTGEDAGWLGTSGGVLSSAAEIPTALRFSEIPYIVGHRYVVTRQQLYEYDPQREERLSLRFELAGSERFTSTFATHGSFVTVRTTRAVYFFEPRDLEREPGRVEPTTTVPLDGTVRNVSRIHVAELIDSYLLSVIYGSQSERGYHEAKQVVAEVGIDGGYEIVAERTLSWGQPAFLQHRGFILSPLLQHTHDLLWTWIGPGREERVSFRDIVSHPVPATIAFLAFLVAALSAALTAWIARQRHLERAHGQAWTLAAFCLGLPCFLSFLFLTSRSEQADVPEPNVARTLGAPQVVPVEGWSS
jgi:hypothetical protein